MPRRPRLVVPGIPMHVTQRGVNRAPIFVDDGDFQRYRDLLVDVFTAHELPLHAYALMGNHVHLLVTPNDATGLARAMRLLNQRYVAGFNRRHERTGTLWESRFRSCLVDSERYLLVVYRYIDLNPVRAGIVDEATAYRWSSARANLGLGADRCLAAHPLYLSLGDNPGTRVARYRAWIEAGICDAELAQVRAHVRQQRALGSQVFQELVEESLRRPVGLRSRGRPRKIVSDTTGVVRSSVSNE